MESKLKLYTAFKRILDFIFAFIGIIIFSPIVLVYSLFIFLFYNTSPFIHQKRGVGTLNGRIKILKLITLKPGNKVINNGSNTFKRTVSKDSYIPFGKFLRTTGIDESPQLIHVLSGKMSLIGPRPLILDDLVKIMRYKPEYINTRNNFKSKPGISGLWQIERCNALSFDELLKLDTEYELNKSIKLEIILLFKTIKKVLIMKHIDTLELQRTRQVITTSPLIAD